ncbi:hypothetical protein METP3_02886 [Methanosarcinales archaeon]|nr:hypothetical protein METP3_02886 [Methanosarcinales archaeon]
MKNTTIIAVILAIIMLSGCIGRPVNINDPSGDKEQPANTIYKPQYDKIQTPTPTPGISENLLIDNISRDLKDFNEKGWDKLYETNEFNCSRMTTFIWDYIRTKYKITSKIIVAPNREHAWLAVRVRDAGDTDRYMNWTLKGVDYYFIESTVPRVVTFEKDVYFNGNWYASTSDFYTTRIYMADDPSQANDLTGGWSTEFRLTKPDIDKLSTFE